VARDLERVFAAGAETAVRGGRRPPARGSARARRGAGLTAGLLVMTLAGVLGYAAAVFAPEDLDRAVGRARAWVAGAVSHAPPNPAPHAFQAG
jgi:hypothetical protein